MGIVSLPRPVDADTVRLIEEAFSHAWAKDTSIDPAHWTPENPSWGHADVAAIAVQTIMCGDILEYNLFGTPFASLGRHYRNRLMDGTEIGFTDGQFGNTMPSFLGGTLVHSTELLGYWRPEWKGKKRAEVEQEWIRHESIRRRSELFRGRALQAIARFERFERSSTA